MIVKAGDVVRYALFEILEASDEAPIEASEMQVGLFNLNTMMSRWSANGYNLGFTNVSTPADIVTVPLGAIDGIISNLAISLAAQFPGAGISEALRTKAVLGLKAIRRLSIEVIPSNYPDALPIGSGNQCSGDRSGGRFYGTPEEPIITEPGNYIAAEEGEWPEAGQRKVNS